MPPDHDPDILPQPLGDFRPIDLWQAHINEIFYGLCGRRVRDFYQTFAAADYRLAYALAEDYYRKVCRRERDRQGGQSGAGGRSPDEPGSQGGRLTIMEWGCGNGNLAACFLDRLKELDKDGLVYPRTHYMLVDVAPSVLEDAKANPDLAKHRERTAFLCEDATALKGVADGSVDRIICNELWSELPTKLLLRKEGEVLEEYIRPNLSERKLAAITDWSAFATAFDRKEIAALEHYPPFLQDLLWEREYHKVDATALPFRKTVSEFLKGIDEEVLIPANLGAGATLKEAKRLLAPDAVGFSSFDAGTADHRVLNDPEKPCYTLHGGQFSFMVNVALLKEMAGHLGIDGLGVEPQKEFLGRSLGTNVLSLMDLLASHWNQPAPDSWESDALVLKTLRAMNDVYQGPYRRKIEFPIRDSTPAAEREVLEELVRGLKPDGVPDTIAYLTEEEIWEAMPGLEALGYDREGIRAALMAFPPPVDYVHVSFEASAIRTGRESA